MPILHFALSLLLLLVSRLSPSQQFDFSQSSTTGEDIHAIRFAPPKLILASLDLLFSPSSGRPRPLLARPPHTLSSQVVWLLTITSGDIELNPGPFRKYKHPCGVCSGPVKSNQKGIYCDICNSWLHARCIGLSNTEYSLLQDSPDTWACRRCLCEALPYHDIPTLTPPASPALDPPRPPPGPSPNSSQVSILLTNCRSVYHKLDELRTLTLQHHPHVICLCETWLDHSIADTELFLPNYSLIRRDRNRHGGGIALYIHSSLGFKILSSHPVIELLIIDLSLNNRRLTCALFYRPPSSDVSVLQQLEDTLDSLPPGKCKSLLLLGDFNIDASLIANNQLLSSIQAKHDLSQVVSLPTRSTMSTSSTIDHIYISSHLPQSHSILSPLSSSDHSCILLSLPSLKFPQITSPRRVMWLYQRADFEHANSSLESYQFNPSSSTPIDDTWKEWYSTFMNTMSSSIPTRVIKRPNGLPYLTSNLVRLIRLKHRSFKAAKQLATEAAWSKYRRLRNNVTAALKAARSRFLNSLTSNINSPQDFWKKFHKLSPKTSRIPVNLSLDTCSESSSTGKANLLNRFFASCFSKASSTKFLLEASQNQPTFTSICTNEDEVHKLLSHQKINTATGPDGISGRMLRATAPSIAKTLSKIFNISLTQGKIPTAWKALNINPIPKSKDISQCSNYRPISLLSLPSKILERIIHTRISGFLYDHNLLSRIQFGFRSRSSTQEALLSVTNTWYSMLSKHKQVAAVFLDVKKAFDSVPHYQLIRALHSIGIQGPLLNWLRDYLTSRSQQVILDGVASNPIPVTSGVPQGSILGPLLFNIFMNSISSVPISSTTHLILYADDILLFKPIDNTHDETVFQHDIQKISSWIRRLGLTPNHLKTQYLPITRSTKTLPLRLSLDGHTITPSTSVKYLGVTISANLSWSEHIHKISITAKQLTGRLHRCFRDAPPHLRHCIYQTTILPKLDYCSAIWDPHLIKDKNKLEGIQKFAGRVITKNWLSDYQSICSKLNLKPLHIRRHIQKLKLCHKILSNSSCIDSTHFTPHPHPSPRSSNSFQLFRPHASTRQQQASFFFEVIPHWNALPEDIVDAPSINSFKTRLNRFYTLLR